MAQFAGQRRPGSSVRDLRRVVGRVAPACGATNNWTFTQDAKPPPWTFDLERVVLSDGEVKFDDSVTRTHVRANVTTLDQGGKYGIAWTVADSYNGAPVTGNGKAGAALDVHLALAGRSMARLYEFTGILLPETPPFATAGRLTAAIDRHGSTWTYDQFKGKVGSSDIGGKLAYATGKPRGTLTGNVESKLLSLRNLGPLVGADSNASKKERGVTETQPGGKVLPVEAFRTERWKTIDADVRYGAARIAREKALPITQLNTHIVMDNGVMTLAPLGFGVAGGDLRSTIRLDGSGGDGNRPSRRPRTSRRAASRSNSCSRPWKKCRQRSGPSTATRSARQWGIRLPRCWAKRTAKSRPRSNTAASARCCSKRWA
jgi:uncharacterized protein involved in outer membrane biogenesis